jgi:hypothetical protein
MRRQYAAGRVAANHFTRAGAAGVFYARDKPLELRVIDDRADDLQSKPCRSFSTLI